MLRYPHICLFFSETHHLFFAYRKFFLIPSSTIAHLVCSCLSNSQVLHPFSSVGLIFVLFWLLLTISLISIHCSMIRSIYFSLLSFYLFLPLPQNIIQIKIMTGMVFRKSLYISTVYL